MRLSWSDLAVGNGHGRTDDGASDFIKFLGRSEIRKAVGPIADDRELTASLSRQTTLRRK
jgi:hypothetical protein